MDVPAAESLIEVNFPFSNISEIEELRNLLAASIQPEDKEGGGPGEMISGMTGKNFAAGSMMLRGKKLVRTTTVSESMENPLADESLGEEGEEMMREMFADAAIIYIMEFPGKVKKVKGFPGHEVQNNLVIQTLGMMELFDDPGVITGALSGEVKFKR